MNKLLKIALTGAMAFSVVACGGTEEPKEEVVTLTAGISPDYAPYESLNKEGEMVGFDIDMAELLEGYLEEETGKDYEIEFKQMDFDNIVTQIQGDQVDLGISGFTYAEDRVVEWSEPYLGTDQVAVVPADSEIKTVADLAGKKLVAQTGTTGENCAKEVEDVDYVGLKNVQDIFNALGAKQYDAAVVDSGVANQYAKSGKFVVLDEVLLAEKNFIIAKEGNTEVIELINKAIAKFLASEEYTQMCDEYELVPLTVEE